MLSRRPFLIVALLAQLAVAGRAEQTPPAPDAQAPTTNSQTPASDTQTPAPDSQTPAPDSQTPPPDTHTPAPDTQNPASDTQTGDTVARFSTTSDLVVLHVSVRDRSGRYVPDVPKSAFTVFEDGQPQRIEMFTGEDAPVTAGLILDSSVSIWNIRELVITGAVAFAQASNPKDEIFGLAFNEEVRPVLPASRPFTSDVPTLREALGTAVIARGRTALFDAIAAGLEYAARGSHARRVLVLISDGGDNASHATFEDIVRRTETSNAVIYSVAVVDPLDTDAKPRLMKQLADATGGESFRPATATQIDAALKQIARDIRQSYTIGYTPSRAPDGTFRRVRVLVSPPNGERVTVRTRSGYLATPAASLDHLDHLEHDERR
jgi:Ca-activated chloride channel family protein